MKVRLGRSIVLRLSRKTASGALTTVSGTVTSRPSWALVLNDGTVRVTSIGTVKQLEMFSTQSN